ncbi:MAG: hypothetical protein WAM58_06310 [Candidatus Acidiferrum sp.]
MKFHAPSHLVAVLSLAAILACTPPAGAQSVPAEQPTPVSPASAPDPAFLARANATIDHSRKLIDAFFEQTSNVVCTENVEQTLVGKNNKPMYREESVFEYQLQSTNNRGGSLRLTESRETRKAAFRDPNKTLLITNGFASLLLILHERYESSYTFDPLSEETTDNRTALHVHFKAVPGGSSPAAIQLLGRNYPLPLKGDIWIDEETGAITKLASSLDGSLADLGLRDIQTEIHYSLVQFHAPEEAYWMPASAIIDVQTPKQHWRNVHHFSAYRRFRATIQVQLGDKQP